MTRSFSSTITKHRVIWMIALFAFLILPSGQAFAQTAPAPTPQTTSSTRTEALLAPQLAVPIPGVNLTPPIEEAGVVTVPFMAQYISGIYRYLLGISTLVAIIMVIYGGFLYLLGATQGKAGEGLGYIKDAIGGLVVLYSSYVILWVVNPNLINLQPIQLQSVASVGITEESIGEGAGADGDFGEPSGASSCHLTYNQGQALWRDLVYGNSISLISDAQDTRPACTNVADSNGTSCIGTFSLSGCGPTAVASVLAFYGLQISIPDRVPSPGSAPHLIDPIDMGIYAVKKNYRIVGGGTGHIASVSSGFPQFKTRVISKTNIPAILSALRAGHPLVFACPNEARKRLPPAGTYGVHLYTDDAATQPLLSRAGSPEKYLPGHYMVLSGVVNDQILRVHDVGSTRTRTIRVADYQEQCGDATEITPKPGAPETVTAVWSAPAIPNKRNPGRALPATTPVTVQMRLPAQAGSQCSSIAP